MSPKTAKNIHGIFHRALEQAVKLGMIRSNPTDLCDLPKARRKEIHPMEEKEISAFSKAIKGGKYEIVYKVFKEIVKSTRKYPDKQPKRLLKISARVSVRVKGYNKTL